MEYGFCVTDAGRYLIARLLTGETMHITKVMVGRGRIPDGVRMASVTDLFDTVAQATSNAPACQNGVAYMTIEYNNSLNGGLDTGFWLGEFGIFALDPVAGEVMICYGTLGDYPQYVSAYSQSGSAYGVDVRRFPVAIAIGEDRGMVVDYHTDLWLTAEDLDEYYSLVIKPLIIAEIEDKLDEHDKNPAAHDGTPHDLRNDIRPRVCMAELLEELTVTAGTEAGYAHEGIEAFITLDNVSVTNGNWNDRLCRIEC